MPLIDSQAKVRVELLDMLKRGEKRIILKGAAGVGKTYFASELMRDFKSSYEINNRYNNGLIYATAPTNKALAVLQGKIQGVGIEFKTIHSALKLKRVIDSKTGNISFIPAYSKNSRDAEFKDCKICVIDESSMVNTQILGLLRDYKFPIIFIGDEFQINPVGELETPVFNSNYPTLELTEIIRQGAGNPIIDLSRDIDLVYFKQPNIINGKGYVYNDNINQLIDQLAEVNGTDEMKYLAWTNVQIDSMNVLVRERRYGKPKRIEVGETLVFNSPFESYYTNKEVKVEELSMIIDKVPIPRYDTKFDSMDLPVNGTDYIRLKYYRVNNSFNIVHEDSDSVFKSISSTLKDNCKKHGWNWKGHFFFQEQFADIKYNHAISVHKSQGSTYKSTVINIGNINFNKNQEERKRLLYTAITRASDLVILNNVK